MENIYLQLLKAITLDKFADILTILTKYPPFSSYGKHLLLHHDNHKYWVFWEKMVKGWYQIWIKNWESDNYFIYFYCGLDNPGGEERIREVQKHIDKKIGEGIVKVGPYQNQTLTLRIPKNYFDSE